MEGAATERAREKVLSFVAAHPEPCSLTVADVLIGTAMTRSTLYRALQGEGGVDAFLMTVRLKVARALLEAGVSLADVRNRCGFRSGSHFSRRYKRKYGVPPSAHGCPAAVSSTSGSVTRGTQS